DQQLAWRGIEDDLRRDARIDAADVHDLRPLSGLRQRFVARPLIGKAAAEEGAIACGETFGKHRMSNYLKNSELQRDSARRTISARTGALPPLYLSQSPADSTARRRFRFA